MISTKDFEEMLLAHKIETLASTLISDSKGYTEGQIHTNLSTYDKIEKLSEWNQGSTLASPFGLLDFRSIKERLAEGLYFSANYDELRDSEVKSHEFYIDAVKGCLEAALMNS